MRIVRNILPVFIIFPLLFAACSQKKESTPNVENQQVQADPLAGDGKTLVSGCNGTGYTLGGAVDALKKPDYAEANRQASCVFNASVVADPKHPDLKAANIALLAKFILITESDQVRNLLLAPNLKATEIFGPAGNPKKLDTTLEAIIGTSDGFEMFYKFLKAHEDKGQNPQAVFDLILSLVRERSVDLHILAKAMASDDNFVDEIPDYLINDSAPKSYKITDTEAGALDFNISAFRFLAEVLQFYHLGISSASSFQGATEADILTKLVADLNTSPKIFELKGSSDATAVIPIFQAVLDSGQRAVEVLSKNDLESWAGDLQDLFPLPKKGETEKVQAWQLTLFQLQKSLEAGEWVQLTAFEGEVHKINAKAFFNPLPDSKSIAELPVEVDGDDIEPREAFLIEFVKAFYKEE
jgi:hypothetical protein